MPDNMDEFSSIPFGKLGSHCADRVVKKSAER